MLLSRHHLNTNQPRPTTRVLLFLSLCLVVGTADAQKTWDTLMPLPRQVIQANGVLELPRHWAVNWSNVPASWRADLGDRLDVIVGNLGLTWGDLSGADAAAGAPLSLAFQTVGRYGSLPREAYELDVGPGGITVLASSPEGFFYALVTFQQLLPSSLPGTETATVAFGTAVDKPAFGWRGLMLDTSRHFFSVPTVLSILESMALHKLNRFHWHLTDDQGWRLEIPGWPALTTKGAWRTETVEWARSRQITVIPEIDLPGHASAALAAYPELSSTGKPREVPLNWNVADGVLSLGRPEVLRFTGDLLKALVELFPGPWIHWGGDEVYRTPWMTNAQSLAWMKTKKVATAPAALAVFWRELATQTLAVGKIPIGWDETVLHKPPAGSLIQWWETPERGLAAVAGGYGVISSWKWHAYLDYQQFNWDVDRQNWMPTVDLAAIVKNPIYPPGATAAQKARVLGLEATLFTERVTEGTWPRKLFPRLALFAEQAWRAVPGGVAGWPARLTAHRARLEAWGVGMFDADR